MRLAVDIPDDLHRRAKVTAATAGTTVRALVLAALERHLSTSTAPAQHQPTGDHAR